MIPVMLKFSLGFVSLSLRPLFDFVIMYVLHMHTLALFLLHFI